MANHLTLERLAHFCMVVFAVASIANISLWLNGTGENVVTSFCVGTAVGTILVILSVILSKVDYKRSPVLFGVMLCAVIAMCLLSGTLQFFAYSKHLQPWQAALLGYLLPVAGEAMVGAAMSMYAVYQRAELLHHADDRTDQRVAEQLAEAMADLDLSKSRDYIQKQVDRLARRKIDATVQRLMQQDGAAELDTASVQSSVQMHDQLEPSPRSTSPISDRKQAETAQFTETMQRAKQSKTAQRREQLYNLLLDRGDIGPSEFASLLDVSRSTVYSDLGALEEAGRIAKVGEAWMPIPEHTVPQPQSHTNGHLDDIAFDSVAG